MVLDIFAGGRTPHLTADEVQRLGYAVMIVPSDLQRAAMHAMRAAADRCEAGRDRQSR